MPSSRPMCVAWLAMGWLGACAGDVRDSTAAMPVQPAEPSEIPGAASVSSPRAHVQPLSHLAPRADLAHLRWDPLATSGLRMEWGSTGRGVSSVATGAGRLVDPATIPTWRAGLSWDRTDVVSVAGMVVAYDDGEVVAKDDATGAVRWRHGDAARLLGVAPSGARQVVVSRHAFTDFVTDPSTRETRHVQWLHGLDAATGSLLWRTAVGAGGWYPSWVGATAGRAHLLMREEPIGGPWTRWITTIDLASGARLWDATLDACQSPIAEPAGHRIVVACDRDVRILDGASGSERGRIVVVTARDRIEALSVRDDTAFTYSTNGDVSALDLAPAPALRWRRDLGVPGGATLVAAADALFSRPSGAELIALDLGTGDVRWRYGTDGSFALLPELDGGPGVFLAGVHPTVLARGLQPAAIATTPIRGTVTLRGRPLAGVRVYAGRAAAVTNRWGGFEVPIGTPGWIPVTLDRDDVVGRARRRGYLQVFLPHAVGVEETERRTPLRLEVRASRAPPVEDCDCC